jgi:AAA family ATP:ADP antiporter
MLLSRALDLRPGEARRVLAAAAWCFCLLTANYALRPLRDAMGVEGGVEQLPWLFTATFVSMLVATPIYALAVARLGRARLVPIVHRVFALQLLLFFAAMHGWFGEGELVRIWTARVFFVWTSVFNLFVISLFWSVMADCFSGADARRLFGLISVGGSIGAIAGPALGGAMALWATPAMLPLLAAVLLELSLLALPHVSLTESNQAIGGGAFAALPDILRSPTLLGICGYILLLSASSTILYFIQAELVAVHFSDRGERTAVFASIDLAINALTIATQALVTGRVMARIGLGWSLAAVPLLVACGFGLLAGAPALSVMIAVQIARHVSNYAISRPAREVLYTAVDRSQRYKAKSLIDTVIYRGGDALTGWLFAGLTGLGLGLGAIALVGVPLAAAWALLGHRIGRSVSA